MLPNEALLLLQTALPPPGSGDAPPMATSENMKYRLGSLDPTGFLGKGTYGTVLLVRAAHNPRPLALKCVSMSKIDQMGHQAHILAERAVMANLDHPFMPKLYGTFRDSLNVYLLTDFFSGGDLLELYMASFPFSAEAVGLCLFCHRRRHCCYSNRTGTAASLLCSILFLLSLTVAALVTVNNCRCPSHHQHHHYRRYAAC